MRVRGRSVGTGRAVIHRRVASGMGRDRAGPGTHVVRAEGVGTAAGIAGTGRAQVADTRIRVGDAAARRMGRQVMRDDIGRSRVRVRSRGNW